LGTVNVNRWLPFFEPFFESRNDAFEFVDSLERQPYGTQRHRAKIMMHQAQRLISLSDDFPTLRPNNEGLPLLFLLICAENMAKLADNFEEEGHSKQYTRNFFNWFLAKEEKERVRTGITTHKREPSTVDAAVDALYEVRCDIVHEGRYWGFHFHDGDTPMLNCEPDVIVSITLNQLRNIVVKGCIRAITHYPNDPIRHCI
jgi:hypothetical protein